MAPNYVSTAAEGKPIGLAGFCGVFFVRKEIDGKVGSAVSIVWSIMVFLLVASYVVGDCKKTSLQHPKLANGKSKIE